VCVRQLASFGGAIGSLGSGWWNLERLRIGLAKKSVCSGSLVDQYFMEKGVYSTYTPLSSYADVAIDQAWRAIKELA
jgi:hypothetical protein